MEDITTVPTLQPRTPNPERSQSLTPTAAIHRKNTLPSPQTVVISLCTLLFLRRLQVTNFNRMD